MMAPATVDRTGEKQSVEPAGYCSAVSVIQIPLLISGHPVVGAGSRTGYGKRQQRTNGCVNNESTKMFS